MGHSPDAVRRVPSEKDWQATTPFRRVPWHGRGNREGGAGTAVCKGWLRPAHWFIWSRSPDGRIAIIVVALSPMMVEEEITWSAR